MGRGLTAMGSIREMMNMSSPITKITFDDIMSKVHDSYVKTSQESMVLAANSLVNSDETNSNLTASFVDT